MKDRLKRILAFVIDWIVITVPFLGVCTLLYQRMFPAGNMDLLLMLLCFLLILADLAFVILRDWIGRGRSLGKRILGLYVLDKKTRKKPSWQQLCLRNILLFLNFVDGIILLVSGQSMGDRAAGTVVLSQKSLEAEKEAPEAVKKPSKYSDLLCILVIGAVGACFAAMIVGSVFVALHLAKRTDEYKLSYDYFISSETFAELDADASHIRMNRYSHSISSAAGDGHANETTKIGFVVAHRSYTVVCHKEDGVWRVCDECTDFE